MENFKYELQENEQYQGILSIDKEHVEEDGKGAPYNKNEKSGIKEGKVVNLPKHYYKYDKEGNISGIYRGVFVDELVKHVDGFILNDDFYIYEDGYYKRITDNEIKGFLQENINPYVRTGYVIDDIFNMWKYNTKMLADKKEVNKHNHLLNLKNGIYNLKTNKFTPEHDKNELMTIQINAKYKEGLTKEDGQTWHKYLNFALPEQELQEILQEIMGYCLTRYVNAKKFFVFDGVTDSGKSKIIEILTYLIGDENVSNVALQKLHGFNIQYLYNKTLNVFADLPSKPITDDNEIKLLTGEDLAFGDRKHKEAFQFYNKAKMLFSTNGMPSNYGDKGQAFYNRLMIIPFRYAKPKDELDPNLVEKFKREADYIFMWCLEGLRRWYHKNSQKFTKSILIDKEVAKYKTESSTLHQFINEKCQLDKNTKITTERFMHEYQDFCERELGAEKSIAMGRNKVLKTLKNDFGCEYGDNIKDKGKRAVKGIKLTSVKS